MLGLDSTVFTTNAVNATFPGDNPMVAKKSDSKRALSTGAIIGIAVGLSALLIAAITISFLCCRNRLALKKLRGLNSGFDSRFGAPNITSPNSGAYGNPYSTSLPINAAPVQPFVGSHTPSRSIDLNEIKDEQHWQNRTEYTQQIQLPLYSPPSKIPTHQAYIPTSPTGSHSTQFSNSPYHSPQSSPNYPSHLMSAHGQPKSRTTPLASPHSRISPKTSPNHPPQLSTQNVSRGNTITSPGTEQTPRYDFELAERDRKEREARDEVIAPVEKRGKRGKKKARSPDGSDDMNNNLW